MRERKEVIQKKEGRERKRKSNRRYDKGIVNIISKRITNKSLIHISVYFHSGDNLT